MSAYGNPLFQPQAGLSVEGRLDEVHLSLTGSGAVEIGNPQRYGGIWSRWTPLGGGGHSFGPLLGYLQITTQGRNGVNTAHDAIIGVVYQWADGPWWLRISPYVGWNIQAAFFSPGVMLPGSVAGPPLLELGWRPWPNVELALRTSLAPLRVGYVW